MKRILLRLIPILAATGILVGCTTYVQPPPPAPKVEVRPAKPHNHAVWTPGHWKWKGKRQGYRWIPGHWRVVHR